MGVCPDATLMVAQLVGATKPTVQKRIDGFNEKIPGLVQKRVDEGKHVLVVDATSIKGSLVHSGIFSIRSPITRKLLDKALHACRPTPSGKE